MRKLRRSVRFFQRPRDVGKANFGTLVAIFLKGSFPGIHFHEHKASVKTNQVILLGEKKFSRNLGFLNQDVVGLIAKHILKLVTNFLGREPASCKLQLLYLKSISNLYQNYMIWKVPKVETFQIPF